MNDEKPEPGSPSAIERVAEAGSDPAWVERRRRLEAARIALEARTLPTAQRKKEILRARARDLARERGTGEEEAERLEIVEFEVAHERYGMESVHVREVLPLKNLTPLPCTPPFIRGIVNVRGQLLAVIDIKRFFDLPEEGITDLNRVIVLQGPAMDLGILADRVLGTRSIPLCEIQPALPTLTGIREQYLRGVTRDRLVVLDAGKLFADPSLVVDEEVRA